MIRRNDIDGLRAIAVLLVVASHFQLDMFAGGFVGVDVFFVISGYVITLNLVSEYVRRSTTQNELATISVRSFYERRIRRILPITFFVIAVNLTAGFFLYNSLKFRELLTEALSNVFFLGNYYQIRIGTDYLNTTMSDTPLRHLWSLSIEEQFYLFYPLLFFLVLAFHGFKVRGLVLAWNSRLIFIFSSLVLVSFCYSTYEVWSNPTVAYFSTLGRVWEIGVGCIICLVETNLRQRRFKRFEAISSYLGLAAILISALLYDDTTRFPGVLALLPVIGAALLVRRTIQFEKLDLVKRLLSTRILVYLGKLSFSIYLWHWSVIILWQTLFPGILDGNISRVFMFMLILLLSIMSYKFIEVPSSKLNIKLPVLFKFKNTPNFWEFIKRKIAPDTKLVLATIAVLTLIASSMLFLRNPISSEIAYINPDIVATTLGSQNDSFSPNDNSYSINESESIDWNQETQIGLRTSTYSQEVQPAFAEILTMPWGLSLVDNLRCREFDVSAKSQNSKECLSPNALTGKKVLLLGDSHAEMLAPAIDEFYKSQVSLHVITRSACPLGGILASNTLNLDHVAFCEGLWTDYIPSKLTANRYDLIVLTDDGGTNPFDVDRAKQNVKNLDFKGAKVVFVSASPRYPNPIDCVNSNNSIATCSGRPNETGEKIILEIQMQIDSTLTQLSLLMCSGRICPPVIAKTFVTRDGSHFTGPFTRLLVNSLNLPVL